MSSIGAIGGSSDQPVKNESPKEPSIWFSIFKKAIGAFLALNAVQALSYALFNWSDKKAHFIRFNLIAGIAFTALAIVLLI